MLFNEIYSTYYSTVAKIINKAIEKSISDKEIQQIIEKNAFSESILNILPALKNENWQLLKTDGTTNIQHSPTRPLTDIEKQWLKAISLDKRIQLFDIDFSDLEDVRPLFTPDDIYIFDQYTDGDNYSDENYINRFRIILMAIKEKHLLKIVMLNRHNKPHIMHLMPKHLEYSEKDDKFRLICETGEIINLGRITDCKLSDRKFSTSEYENVESNKSVTIELIDERNALERMLLHFAHFEKKAEKIGDKLYRIEITYARLDETEMIIRILSFGPMIKVVSPQNFVNQITKRLENQKLLNL